MLSEHTEEMPVKACVLQLSKGRTEHSRRHLFDYLDRLNSKDSSLSVGYEDLLLELYADFKPEKLMGFLKEDPEIDFPKVRGQVSMFYLECRSVWFLLGARSVSKPEIDSGNDSYNEEDRRPFKGVATDKRLFQPYRGRRHCLLQRC